MPYLLDDVVELVYSITRVVHDIIAGCSLSMNGIPIWLTYDIYIAMKPEECMRTHKGIILKTK